MENLCVFKNAFLIFHLPTTIFKIPTMDNKKNMQGDGLGAAKTLTSLFSLMHNLIKKWGHDQPFTTNMVTNTVIVIFRKEPMEHADD
jgi:hypothetical protein